MYEIKIAGNVCGPYEATLYPDGKREGNIMPIMYDTAEIHLSDASASYAIGYKRSKNLFGKEISSLDAVHMTTGESFSFQADNVFILKVIGGDLKALVRSGGELRYYENFGRSEHWIEADGDKSEVVPVGAYGRYLRMDEDWYYPLVIDPQDAQGTMEKRFHDFYGFRSYEDGNGKKHFLLLIESETSTAENEVWFWTDNFVRISDTVDFGDDSEYVEDWSVDSLGRISMTVTSGARWHMDASGKFVRGMLAPVDSDFSFVRACEDTDSPMVVGKNDKGYFVFDSRTSEITPEEQRKITYFPEFVMVQKSIIAPLFLFRSEGGEIVLVDETGKVVLVTDLDGSEKIESIVLDGESARVRIANEGERTYLA